MSVVIGGESGALSVITGVVLLGDGRRVVGTALAACGVIGCKVKFTFSGGKTMQKMMGLVRRCIEDYNMIEADDILATWSSQAGAQGWQVLVCSGDRDTIQLVTDNVTLLYPSVQGVSQLKRYTPDAVVEKYGLPPANYPDIAALVGETSDNLPGVPGVGPKTAAKWLDQYEGLENLLRHADEIRRFEEAYRARHPYYFVEESAA